MTRTKHLLLPFTLLLLSANALADAQNCQAIEEADVVSLFGQWNASLQTGKPAEVARQYREDAVLLPTLSAKPRLTSAERIDYFEHFLKDGPSGRLDSQHVTIGCNSTTLSGLYTFAFNATGKQVAARYTFTYQWDGQQWLISHHHSSLLPAS